MRILCRVSSLCCAAGSRFLRPFAKALLRSSAVCSRPAAVRDRERNDRGRGRSLGRDRSRLDHSRGARGSGRKRLRGGGLGLGARPRRCRAGRPGGAFGGIRTNGGGSSPTSTGHGSGPGTRPSGTWTNRRRLTPCGRPKTASRRPRGRGSIPPTWIVDGGEIMYRRGGAAEGRHHAPLAAADDHGGYRAAPTARASRWRHGRRRSRDGRWRDRADRHGRGRAPTRRPGRPRHRRPAGRRPQSRHSVCTGRS